MHWLRDFFLFIEVHCTARIKRPWIKEKWIVPVFLNLGFLNFYHCETIMEVAGNWDWLPFCYFNNLWTRHSRAFHQQLNYPQRCPPLHNKWSRSLILITNKALSLLRIKKIVQWFVSGVQFLSSYSPSTAEHRVFNNLWTTRHSRRFFTSSQIITEVSSAQLIKWTEGLKPIETLNKAVSL